MIIPDYTSPGGEVAYLEALAAAQDYDGLIAGGTAANMDDIKNLSMSYRPRPDDEESGFHRASFESVRLPRQIVNSDGRARFTSPHAIRRDKLSRSRALFSKRYWLVMLEYLYSVARHH